MFDNWWAKMVFSPSDDAGGGAGAGGAAPGGADDPPPDAGAGGAAPGEAGDPPPADLTWWQGDGITDDQRDFLAKNGLTVDDPVEAAAKAADMARHAQKHLGRKPEDILVRPPEGTNRADWMRENASLFDLPETAEGYKFEKPEGWEGDWDSTLEGKVRQIAFDEGISQAAGQRLVEAYAGHLTDQLKAIEDESNAASQAMNEALRAKWGGQFEANKAMATQAAQVLFDQMGFDGDTQANLLTALEDKAGGGGAGAANVLAFFHHIGKMLGEDTLTRGDVPGGLGTTPAEARAQAARMRAPGGEYYEATLKGNRAEMDRLKPIIERLDRIASGK